MPHEKIYARPEVPMVGEPESRPIVHVDWADERWVRLGCVQHPDKPYSEQGPRAYFVDLDRESINKLVRALRRARDRAYGKDE